MNIFLNYFLCHIYKIVIITFYKKKIPCNPDLDIIITRARCFCFTQISGFTSLTITLKSLPRNFLEVSCCRCRLVVNGQVISFQCWITTSTGCPLAVEAHIGLRAPVLMAYFWPAFFKK